MLEEQGYDVQDYGCHDESSVDYPDFAHPVAHDIDTNKIELGIVLCGSGMELPLLPISILKFDVLLHGIQKLRHWRVRIIMQIS